MRRLFRRLTHALVVAGLLVNFMAWAGHFDALLPDDGKADVMAAHGHVDAADALSVGDSGCHVTAHLLGLVPAKTLHVLQPRPLQMPSSPGRIDNPAQTPPFRPPAA